MAKINKIDIMNLQKLNIIIYVNVKKYFIDL